MKYIVVKYLFAAAFFAAMLAVASCEKDEGKLPEIAFKTGVGYTSANATVAPNTAVLIGISAHKTEDKDVLKTLSATVSYDGGTATNLFSEALTGTQGDHYEKDLPIVTRSQAGMETYTFTVVNRDGLTNSVSLTLTVQ